MPVNKANNGRTWIVDICRKGKRFRQKGIDSRREALKIEKWAKDELNAGRMPNPKAYPPVKTNTATLNDLYEAAHRSKWYGQKSTSQDANACRIIEILGGKQRAADSITRAEINKFVDKMRSQGKSDATLNHYLSAFRVMYKVGIDEGLVSTMPKLPFFKGYKGRIRFISIDEEERMLNFLKYHIDWSDFIIIMLDTGARNSELENCLATDYSKSGLSFCRTKNNKNRTVPLTDRSETIVKRRLQDGNRKLFPSYNASSLSSLWDRLRKHMGLEDDPQFIPYICRHTCASRLVQAGVDLRRVQEWMGHKCIETTLKYAHLAPDSLISARDDLMRFMSNEREAYINSEALTP